MSHKSKQAYVDHAVLIYALLFYAAVFWKQNEKVPDPSHRENLEVVRTWPVPFLCLVI